MKKITSIFALLLCVFVFSCSNDDDKETSSLQIVSSNVTFESAGGTGTIKVNAISEITATSNKDWCTVSVNGDIINVSVIENNDMSGRTAAVTMVKHPLWFLFHRVAVLFCIINQNWGMLLLMQVVLLQYLSQPQHLIQ